MTKRETLTVGQLIEKLSEQPKNEPVRVWLPGSTIALNNVFIYQGIVCIEGNVDPGSVLYNYSAQ